MAPGALLYDSLSGGTPINPSTFVYDPSSRRRSNRRHVPKPDLGRRLFHHVRAERRRHLFAVRHVHPGRGAGAGDAGADGGHRLRRVGIRPTIPRCGSGTKQNRLIVIVALSAILLFLQVFGC